ncbi:MAG: xanthine dehydrogenase family protein molybdopterin-binding subunit [Sporichthyaceae bacterium]
MGQPLRRKEDAHLITGRTRWTDNIQLPGMLHAAYLRSPIAHARITVDTSAAKAYPGVVVVMSAADFGAAQAIIPEAWTCHPEMKKPIVTPLATDKVHFVGEPIAIVVAETRAQANDALEAINVDYDPLPAVVDMEAALAPDSALVNEDIGTNQCYDLQSPGESYEAAKAKADVVIKRRFRQQRLAPAYMEPRAVVVVPTYDDYTIYTATQIPHVVRVVMSLLTGISESKLRVVAPDVGGGFGGKIGVHAEEIITLLVAKQLGRPIKWCETRSENFQYAHHGRDQIQDIEVAAKSDGTLLGVKVDLMADLGAHLKLFTAGVPLFGAGMFNGIYKMEGYQFNCKTVFTTKTPTDAYRGAGRPEATFGIERMMSELAAELDMDPLEIRRKNWIKHEEFPYMTISGMYYDSGNYEAATDKALELFGYEELRAEQKRRRDAGEKKLLGIGISTFTEACGLAPSRALGPLGVGAGGWERAEIRVTITGKVQVISGSTPHGQGHWTSWSQLVSDKLGIPFEDIELLAGDTASSPQGMDTYGSRSLVVGGSAIVKACDKVIAKARRVAAHTLEVAEDDLEFAAGAFSVKGSPGSKMLIQECAFATHLAHNIPDGMEPSLNSAYTFDPVNLSFPHGTHLCAIEVDTETGFSEIYKYVCVDDVGTVVNPMIVEGQIHGGLAQGIAQALYEEVIFDSDGNQTSGSFVDYLVPSAADLPNFITDRTETPTTDNPIGAKGVGEAGCIASTPAVVNAIVDAIRHYGINDVQMPCTPERVWRAINEAKKAHPHGGAK